MRLAGSWHVIVSFNTVTPNTGLSSTVADVRASRYAPFTVRNAVFGRIERRRVTGIWTICSSVKTSLIDELSKNDLEFGNTEKESA